MSNLEPLNEEVHIKDTTYINLLEEIVGFSIGATPAKLNYINQTLLTEGFRNVPTDFFRLIDFWLLKL